MRRFSRVAEIEEGCGAETSVSIHVQFAYLHGQPGRVVEPVHYLLCSQTAAGRRGEERRDRLVSWSGVGSRLPLIGVGIEY